MKKAFSVLLAATVVFSCLGMSVYADDPVTTTPSGFYVGQILKVGDSFSSFYSGVEFCAVTYAIAEEDVENVTSALGSAYADALAMTQFRDEIASFTSQYGGVYTVKGGGEDVDNMMDNSGKFIPASDIKTGDDKSVEIVLTIDYKYARTTYYDYTTITAWEVTKVSQDDEGGLDIALKAIWTTREPTSTETFVEKLYAKYISVRDALLDILGNYLLKLFPAFLATWAQFLRDISKG